MAIHSCVSSNCTGNTFHQLSINCSTCKEIMYLNCIKHKPGMFDLLKALRMVDITGSVIINQLESISLYSDLRAIFSADSLIRFNCDKCNKKSSGTDISSTAKKLSPISDFQDADEV